MGRKKRRLPVPGFGNSTPFNPIGSHYDTLAPDGIFPYCAMLQIAEEDKYVDYVMCRGFDTRMGKFVDYEEGNDDKPGIAVAKPYGNRVKCYYQKWSIYPCLLPTQQGTASETAARDNSNFTPPSPSAIDWRVGQNPGKPVASCLGQTQASDDIIREMLDHNNNYVNWQLIDSGPVFIWVYLLQNLFTCGSARAAIAEVDAAGEWCEDCEHTELVVSDPFGVVPNSALASAEEPKFIPAGYNALVHRVMFPGETTPPRKCQWAVVTFGTPDCCVDRSTLSVGSGSSSSAGANPCVFGDCSWIWLLADQMDDESGSWTENTDTCAILTNCQCAQADPPSFPGTFHGQVETFPCESTE